MTSSEPFTYTDPDGDKLIVGFVRMISDRTVIPSVAITAANDPDSATAYVRIEDTERVVTAIRAASGVQPDTRPVPTGYGDGKGRAYCLRCAPLVGTSVPLTSEDVDPGEVCSHCHRNIVDVAQDAVPARPVPDTERRDRYAAAIRETDGWVLDDGQHMLDAVMAVADEEQRDLGRKLAAAESIRENADFHLGREMARRQMAEKEVTRLRAELGKARATASHVWQVWCEDGPVHGFYATEDDAKQGSIDCWQETEPSCPDYSWAKDGPRLELLVGGVRGGVCISRQPVYGRHLTAPAAPGGQAEDGAQQ